MTRMAVYIWILVLGLASSCGSKDKKTEEEKEQARIGSKQDKMEVKVEKVRFAPFEMELVSNGTVEAGRKAVLGFVVGDVISKVYVKNGERVK